MRLVVVFLSIAIALFGCSRGDEQALQNDDAPTVKAANMVFTNGKVYTVNEAQPWAQAVAVAGNKIVYVGDDAGAMAYVGDGTDDD